MCRFKGKVNTYIPKIMVRKVHSSSIHNGKKESESRSVMSDSLQPHGLFSPWTSPGQNIGVGSRSLLQGIFPTQGSNQGLLHWRRTLYQLSTGEDQCQVRVFSPFIMALDWKPAYIIEYRIMCACVCVRVHTHTHTVAYLYRNKKDTPTKANYSKRRSLDESPWC